MPNNPQSSTHDSSLVEQSFYEQLLREAQFSRSKVASSKGGKWTFLRYEQNIVRDYHCFIITDYLPPKKLEQLIYAKYDMEQAAAALAAFEKFEALVNKDFKDLCSLLNVINKITLANIIKSLIIDFCNNSYLYTVEGKGTDNPFDKFKKDLQDLNFNLHDKTIIELRDKILEKLESLKPEFPSREIERNINKNLKLINDENKIADYKKIISFVKEKFPKINPKAIDTFIPILLKNLEKIIVTIYTDINHNELDNNKYQFLFDYKLINTTNGANFNIKDNPPNLTFNILEKFHLKHQPSHQYFIETFFRKLAHIIENPTDKKIFENFVECCTKEEKLAIDQLNYAIAASIQHIAGLKSYFHTDVNEFRKIKEKKLYDINENVNGSNNHFFPKFRRKNGKLFSKPLPLKEELQIIDNMPVTEVRNPIFGRKI